MKKLVLFLVILLQLNANTIEGLIKSYFNAVSSRDLSQIRELLYRPDNKRLTLYKMVFGGVEQNIRRFSLVDKKIVNDKAIVKVHLSANIKDKFSSRSFDEEVDLIFLLQQEGGNWKIAKVISDADFDIRKKLLFLQNVKEKMASKKQNSDTSNAHSSYLGCFKDSGDPFGTENRDLNGLFVSKSDMTVKKCINLCKSKGFKYAGVEYGSQCFCGNSYGKYGKADNCNMKCSGNANEICGGFWAINIYTAKAKKRDGAKENLKEKNGDIIYNSADSGENFLNYNPKNKADTVDDTATKEPLKPQKGNLIDLQDEFNFGFNSSIWEVYEWKTLKPLDGDNLVHNGYLDLQCNKTDRSAFVATKPIPLKKGEVLHIKMRIRVHYANKYFEGGVWFYATDVGKKVTMPSNPKAWLSAFGRNLFNVTHYHYYYEKPGVTPYVPVHNGFAISSMNWRKDKNYGIIDPIWDRWFIEEIEYNPAKREAILKIGNRIKKVYTPPYNKKFIRFIIHSYGWYTGHSLQVDWIRIRVRKADKSGRKNETKTPYSFEKCKVIQSKQEYFNDRKIDYLDRNKKNVYLACQVKNLPNGAIITSQWFYNYNGKEYSIGEKHVRVTDSKRDKYLTIRIENLDSEWPSGEYKVVIKMNGKYITTINYKMR